MELVMVTYAQFDLEIAKKLIYKLDLLFIERYLVDNDGYSEEYARKAIISYRHLLELKLEYPDNALALSTLADKALHAHILHTRRYAEDMQAIFGGVLHHDPGVVTQEAREFYQQVFFKHFGGDAENLAMCTVSLEKKQPDAESLAMCTVSLEKKQPDAENLAMCTVSLEKKQPDAESLAMCTVSLEKKQPDAENLAMCTVSLEKKQPDAENLAMCTVSLEKKIAA
jgi:hypothetical protein